MRPRAKQRGFSLAVIILIFAAIGLLALGGSLLTAKVAKVTTERKSGANLGVIRDAAKKFYRAHESLPAPAAEYTFDPDGAGGSYGTIACGVPVDRTNLNLDQSYRLDTWGQPVVYYLGTGINGVEIMGADVAGFVLSYGPNQVYESNLTSGTTPRLDLGGDDVMAAINVKPEAVEIALDELTTLSRKNCAYRKAVGNWWPDAAQPPAPTDAEWTVFLTNFGLAQDTTPGSSLGFQHDPWANDYEWVGDPGDAGGFWRSAGPDGTAGTSDDISAPQITDTLCAYNMPGMPVTDGLVGYYPFDDGSGDDFSGNDNHGTFQGSQTTTTTGGGGIVGEALDLTSGNNQNPWGTGYYVLIPNSPTLTPTDELSLVAWVKSTQWVNAGPVATNKRYLFSKGSAYGLHGQHFANNAPPEDGVMRYWINADNNFLAVGAISTVPPDAAGNMDAFGDTVLDQGLPQLDEWRHVVLTFDNTNTLTRLYYDGNLVAVGNVTQQINPDSNAVILGGREGYSQFFTGLMDEVAIFDRALTPCEVRLIYNVAANVGYDAIGYWPFNRNVKDESGPDKTGNGHDGTLMPDSASGPSRAPDRYGCDDKALDFDGGTASYVELSFNPSTEIGVDQDFTVSFWVDVDAVPTTGTQYNLALGSANSGLPYLWIGIDRLTGRWNYGYRNRYRATTASAATGGDNWRHIVLRFNSTGSNAGDLDFFVNGVQIGSTYSTTFSSTYGMPNANMLVGRGGFHTGVDGRVDDVAIFTHALTDNEIDQIYRGRRVDPSVP